MEEFLIKRPALGMSDYNLNKFLAICCVFPVIYLTEVSGINPRSIPWPLSIGGFMGCVFLLFIAIKKILMIPKRTYLTINDDRVIVNERRGEWEVRFDEVKSFECETTKLWRFNLPTDHMIVHLKNGNGYVKMFSTDGLTIKQHELCDLLNERLQIFNEKISQ